MKFNEIQLLCTGWYWCFSCQVFHPDVKRTQFCQQ